MMQAHPCDINQKNNFKTNRKGKKNPAKSLDLGSLQNETVMPNDGDFMWWFIQSLNKYSVLFSHWTQWLNKNIVIEGVVTVICHFPTSNKPQVQQMILATHANKQRAFCSNSREQLSFPLLFLKTSPTLLSYQCSKCSN